MGMSAAKITPYIIFEQSTIKLARETLLDPSHVLNSEYEIVLSGRRYRAQSIKLINEIDQYNVLRDCTGVILRVVILCAAISCAGVYVLRYESSQISP